MKPSGPNEAQRSECPLGRLVRRRPKRREHGRSRCVTDIAARSVAEESRMLTCGCDFEGHSGSRTRTARKEHKCGECGTPIKPGDDYEFHTYFGDGYISNHKTCLKCNDLAESMMALGFCWQYGSLLEMHKDYLEAYNPPRLSA